MGKDTLAKYIFDVLRPKSRKLKILKRGFADKVYDVCYAMYSWAGFQTKEYYDQNPAKKEEVLPLIGKTPRKLLIDIGTPVMRSYDDQVWINCTLRDQFDLLLLTDLRFPNEFEAVQKLGGKCIKVVRPSVAPTDDLADCALVGYENRWDEIIMNNAGLAEMYAEAERLVNENFVQGMNY